MRLFTYVQIIIGGIIGINWAFDCRCPEIPPRQEVGEDQKYCGKELKGLDCLPETVYRCITFNQTEAEPPTRQNIDNCGYKRVKMYCSPYSKKICEYDIECLRIRRCFNGKAYADQSLKEWYATIRKNRGQSETGPGDISEQSAVMQEDS